MSVKYNGQSLIPAPLVQIQRQLRRFDTESSTSYNITLNGTIVNVGTSVDSPGASGGLQMGDILSEQKRIRGIFGNNSTGGYLEILAPDTNSNAITAYCTVNDISFSPGVWVNRSDYSISLSTNSIGGDSDTDSLLEDARETWQISPLSDGRWNVTHNLTATGKHYFASSGVAVNALANARNWVSARRYTISNGGFLTAFNPTVQTFLPSSGFIVSLPASGNYWNYNCNEAEDPTGYSTNLTENWLYCPSGNYSENYSVTTSIDVENSLRATVSIAGEVIGNAGSDQDFNTKSQNSKNVFETTVLPNLYLRASYYSPSGYTTDTIATAKQVTYERFTGAIRYSTVYSAYLGGKLIPNSLEENISVSDVAGNDISAQFGIPGRPYPLFQNMHTKSAPQRNITINLRMKNTASGIYDAQSLLSSYLARPDTDFIINTLKPSRGYYFLNNDYIEWNPTSKIYSRQVGWTINPSGTALPSGSQTTFSNPGPN